MPNNNLFKYNWEAVSNYSHWSLYLAHINLFLKTPRILKSKLNFCQPATSCTSSAKFQALVLNHPDKAPEFCLYFWWSQHIFTSSHVQPSQKFHPQAYHNPQCNPVISPFILTVGELGPADCFLHPLQFWQRLSASEMKEQRESSSKRSESSNENLSPSSHSANMSSITSNSHKERKMDLFTQADGHSSRAASPGT